ncbi:MAG: general secretion pathway protein GspB [Gammaproteobacteria bacterium]
MSIILDALRKSESERQQTTGPGIADTRVAPLSNRSRVWIPGLALLLGANFVLLGAFWIGKNIGSSTPAATQVDTREADKPIQKVEAPPTRMPPLEKRTPTVDPATSVKPEQPAQTITAPPPMPVDAKSAAADNSGALPSFEQMVLEGRISGMSLHLDILVSSQVRNERFVFINTGKYREGDRLSEGPMVEEITERGVVLNHNGDRFILSRE